MYFNVDMYMYLKGFRLMMALKTYQVPSVSYLFGANKGSFIKWPKVMGYMFFWQ